MHRAATASAVFVGRRLLACQVTTVRAVSDTALRASVAERIPGTATAPPAAAPGFPPQPLPRMGAAAGHTREGSWQDAWRARRLIVEAGADYRRLLAVLGEMNLPQMDPHNAAIAVTRLAAAAQQQQQPEAAGVIAGDARFVRLVGALHAEDQRLLAAMPPQQLATVAEGLAVFGVKLPGC